MFVKYYVLLNKDIFTVILMSKRQIQYLFQSKSSEFYLFFKLFDTQSNFI
jgi:hypothetical protein